MFVNPNNIRIYEQTHMDGPLSISRTLNILAALAGEKSGASLARIVSLVNCPKTSAFDLLKGLVAAGYVAREDDGRYKLAVPSFVLARKILEKRDMAELAQPVLEALAEQTGETALLGVLNPDGVSSTYIQQVESASPVRYSVVLGEERELYCTSLGKTFLAHMPDAELTGYLKGNRLKAMTPRTITSVADLRKQLLKIRQEGLAYNFDERMDSASSVAAPVVAPSGSVAAVLVVAGPTPRIRKAVVAIANLIKPAASQLSGMLEK